MKKELISRQLVRYLEARGVEHVFGLCGHTNIAVLAEMEKSRVKFVNVRHEQIAAHMADGYARAKKQTAVLLTHLGPGLTNAATGVANAALDSIPMVVIAGDVPTHYHGKHPHQEVNLHADASQFEIYRPFVKRAWRVDQPHLFPEILEKAFALAQSGRQGPVLIDVPMDIFSKEVDVALFERLRLNTKRLHKPSLDEQTATGIVKQLLAAQRPVLYAGGGVMLADATAELREFVDHLQIPVAHTIMGKGALPDDHPFVLGMTGFWGTKFINEQCRAADWILGLGTRFSEADCSSWESEYTFNFPPTRLIHIDIDPAEIGRNYPVETGAVADLKQALAALNRAARKLAPGGVKRPERQGEIAAARALFLAGNRAHAQSSAYPMRPERILADVREALPRDALITTDVGWNKNGVGQQFPIYEPGTIFTPGGYATMGFGAPAALGAKIACPGRVVVALVGDGGFGQNPALLATAFEENIGVVWVIMNNYAFGTIAGLEKAHYGTTFGTVFAKDGKPYSPDYAAIAGAYGIEGVKISSAAEFKPALERAIKADRPCVIDVVMQNEPVPTAGHWNIMDIYSPGRKVHHASTDAVPRSEMEGRHMKHDYSLAHLTALHLSPPELVDAAASAGYRYVGLRLTRVAADDPMYPLATDAALLRETKARLAATGVKVLDIELARLGPGTEPEDFQVILEAGAELGARHVIAQLPDPVRARKIEHFAALCDMAQAVGLTVELEFPSWTETPDLAEATRVLHAVNRPNAGMLVDMLHFARSRSGIEDLKKLPREWFRFAHVCDAAAEIPATNEGLIHTARAERLFPGEGGIDVRGILAAMPQDIPYALEIPRVTLSALVGERECARLALKASRMHLDAPELAESI